MAGNGNPGQFKPGHKGGRPKGAVNKTTRAAKELFALVNEDIGGRKAMAEWARENRTEFYKLYARTIPIDTNLNAGGGLKVTIEGV